MELKLKLLIIKNMKKEYIYKAQIIDIEIDKPIITISSYSQEGLEEEMGKPKWTGAIEKYENELINEDIEEEENE